MGEEYKYVRRDYKEQLMTKIDAEINWDWLSIKSRNKSYFQGDEDMKEQLDFERKLK